MRDEERADRVEASLNVHLQNDAKNVGRIQDDFKRVVEKINVCDDRVDVLQRVQGDQEAFNHAVFARMREMEVKTEAQEERIVALEEEVATLRWKKPCSCGEEGKETVIATGSGEDDASELEYVEEEEVSSGSSYHSPIVASEAPLFVFGSPAETPAPILLSSTCACPVPAIVHLEDDVEMTAIPRENNTPIPVQVERPPRYAVGVQHASRGRPLAHYKSSTRRLNRHAKQLGVPCIPSPETFMGQDTRFPSVREFRAHVLASGGRADQGVSGSAE